MFKLTDSLNEKSGGFDEGSYFVLGVAVCRDAVLTLSFNGVRREYRVDVLVGECEYLVNLLPLPFPVGFGSGASSMEYAGVVERGDVLWLHAGWKTRSGSFGRHYTQAWVVASA